MNKSLLSINQPVSSTGHVGNRPHFDNPNKQNRNELSQNVHEHFPSC